MTTKHKSIERRLKWWDYLKSSWWQFQKIYDIELPLLRGFPLLELPLLRHFTVDVLKNNNNTQMMYCITWTSFVIKPISLMNALISINQTQPFWFLRVQTWMISPFKLLKHILRFFRVWNWSKFNQNEDINSKINIFYFKLCRDSVGTLWI